MRPSVKTADEATAPEFPAETIASASPFLTSLMQTLMEQFFLRRTAATGDSSIDTSSGASTTSSVL